MLTQRDILVLLGCLVGIKVAASSPYHSNHCEDGRTAIVQLFEWRWTDIAYECEHFLWKQGYCGVQISPPNEHAVIEGGSGSPSRPWWERYEPVSYILQSRSGTEDELRDMAERCNNVGIRVYADVVINHLTDRERWGVGSAGSEYDAEDFYFPSIPFGRPDVNSCGGCGACCCVRDEDWGNSRVVRNCQAHNRLDLNQKVPNVLNSIAGYLNSLIELGVAGFRVDSASHVWPGDLEVMFRMVSDLDERWFAPRSRPFIYQDVMSAEGDGVRGSDYLSTGRITNYIHGLRIAEALDDLASLPEVLTPNGGLKLSSNDTMIFVDNHITQRGGNALTYKSPSEYIMATAITLGYSQGLPLVMSSYRFKTTDEGPPYTRVLPENMVSATDLDCGVDCGGSWICEHRWTSIEGMVSFSRSTAGHPVTSFWSEDNMAAWAREGAGFVAMTNNGPLQRSFQTGLPPGSYCDVITGSPSESSCSCTGRTIEVDAEGKADFNITDMTLPVAAIHIDATTDNCTEETTEYPPSTSVRPCLPVGTTSDISGTGQTTDTDTDWTTSDLTDQTTVDASTNTTDAETSTVAFNTDESSPDTSIAPLTSASTEDTSSGTTSLPETTITTTIPTTTEPTTTEPTKTEPTTIEPTTTEPTTTPTTTEPTTTTPRTTTPTTTIPTTTTTTRAPTTTRRPTITTTTTRRPTTTTPRPKVCPPGNQWRRFQNNCYHVSRTSRRTPAAAQTYCRSRGANLVSIHSPAENEFITSFARVDAIWIGAYRNAGDNQWRWRDGSRFVYQNWQGGGSMTPPRRESWNAELYATRRGVPRGKWNILRLNRTHFPACKRPVT